MNEKMRNELRSNVFFIVVGLIAVVYMSRSFVTVVETGKSVWEILADGALGAAFGFLISKLLSLQGLEKGEKQESVQSTVRLHQQAVEAVVPVIDRLDRWCEMKNEENLKVGKSRILARQGIRYEEYCRGIFTIVVDGNLVQTTVKGLPWRKKQAVRKADRLRLTPLTAGALTADGSKPNDVYDFGPDKHAYERRRDLGQILSKVGCGLLFGYFGVRMLNEFSWENLIWTALQTAALLAMGATAYLRAYFFVVDYDRHRIIRKIDNLQKFKIWSETYEKESSQMDEVVPRENGERMDG